MGLLVGGRATHNTTWSSRAISRETFENYVGRTDHES